MKVSFIVPVVNIENGLRNLINSIANYVGHNLNYEIIIINQSNHSIANEFKNLQINEYVKNQVFSASEARNYGAGKAKSEYLFFLDDDALLHSHEICFNDFLEKIQEGDVWFCNRGHIESGKYISHWPKNKKLNTYNFSNFGIEWNLIIRKNIFMEIGGFDLIGTGSKHSALSGELFLLASKLLAFTSIGLLPDLSIAHPKLLKIKNKSENLIGYYYGNGYSVGKSLAYFRMRTKFYWFLRFIGALIYDFIYRNKFYRNTLPIHDYSNTKLCIAKVEGFIDGVKKAHPKSKKEIINL